MSGWEKGLLIALTIILTIGIAALWALLCCSIICSGADALGVILLILGWAGVITGCVLICKRIIRGPRRRTTAH